MHYVGRMATEVRPTACRIKPFVIDEKSPLHLLTAKKGEQQRNLVKSFTGLVLTSQVFREGAPIREGFCWVLQTKIQRCTKRILL
jgi:hypothetical protein